MEQVKQSNPKCPECCDFMTIKQLDTHFKIWECRCCGLWKKVYKGCKHDEIIKKSNPSCKSCGKFLRFAMAYNTNSVYVSKVESEFSFVAGMGTFDFAEWKCDKCGSIFKEKLK